jgi:signal transduction histidine kinase
MASEGRRQALLAVTLLGAGAAAAAAALAGFLGASILSLVIAALAYARFIRGHPAAPVSIGPVADFTRVDLEERLRLAAIVDHAPTPLLVSDQAMRIVAGNRAARQLFRTAERISGPPQALREILTGVRPSGTQLLEIDGERRSYSVRLAKANLSSGEITIISLLDVETELRAAEADAARELLQVLSHEIMGALTPIASLSRSAADHLCDAAPDMGVVFEAVAAVAARAEALERFTIAYRNLARLPAPSPRATDMTDLAAGVARLFRAHYAGRIDLDVAGSPGPVLLEVDPDQMQGALWALLENAAQAALAGDGDRPPRVELEISRARGKVRVAVSDSGAGVPPALEAEIFRPFFTTRIEGSGIGLSLARQIARGHGGDISLVRLDGEGARFVFSLPVVQDQISPESGAARTSATIPVDW